MSENSEMIALVGAPNSGKTTLYNWLTNSQFKTVNYPGATVEYSIGKLAPQMGQAFSEENAEDWQWAQSTQIMDTPGTYSLFPKSADEEVTLKALFQAANSKQKKVSKVIVVVDGTQLSRHLLIVQQLKDCGFAVVVALTMADLLRKNSVVVNISLLEAGLGVPVVPIEGLLGGGLLPLVKALRNLRPSNQEPAMIQMWSEAEQTVKAKQIEGLSNKVLQIESRQQLKKIYDKTAAIDRWLLHPVGGVLLFFLAMFILFSSIFWLANPFMEAVDAGFSWLASLASGQISSPLLADFVSHGVIGSLGSVMVFVPQIFILFLGIGLLESSGYLARAATLIDRPFSKLGMSGRSFVPLLSGFACAVPALMATRNISSKRDRWITNFIIPMMTCSARLPVYALLLSFLFLDQPAWKAGFVLALIYLGSVLLGSAIAGVLNRLLEKSELGLFMMELPLYRRPILKNLIFATYQRTKAYVLKAGPAIFIFSALIWLGTTFPHYEEPKESIRLESSYLSKIGHHLEPIFEPMGGDWRTGVGLLSAFVARETFVSSMALLMNVTEDEASDETSNKGLLTAMQEAKTRTGEKLFTVSSVLGLTLFFTLAMQCLSTFAVAVREMQSWRFAVAQLFVYNILAYTLSVGLVQGLRYLGIS